MVPVAHGADGMGSIRIPAACCGLVGIKPGSGVVPAHLGPNDWYGMAENGALATTVADAALLLSVMADRPDLAAVAEPDRPLRVAVSAKPPITGVTLDVEHLRALIRTVRLLASAGHPFERADPPYPANPLPVLARWFAGASSDAEGMDRDRLDPAVRFHVGLGDQVRARNLVKDLPRDAFRTELARYFDRFDLLVTPTLAQPPIAAARWGQRAWPRTFAAQRPLRPVPGAVELRRLPGDLGAGRGAPAHRHAAVRAAGRPGRRRAAAARGGRAAGAAGPLAPGGPGLLSGPVRPGSEPRACLDSGRPLRPAAAPGGSPASPAC